MPGSTGRFTLLTCAAHLDELRATLQSRGSPNGSSLIRPAAWSTRSGSSPRISIPCRRVERSPDPTDDFLLALSEGGQADYLVTGDKSGLLALGRHKATRIVSAREFAGLLARTSGGSTDARGS